MSARAAPAVFLAPGPTVLVIFVSCGHTDLTAHWGHGITEDTLEPMSLRHCRVALWCDLPQLSGESRRGHSVPHIAACGEDRGPASPGCSHQLMEVVPRQGDGED